MKSLAIFILVTLVFSIYVNTSDASKQGKNKKSKKGKKVTKARYFDDKLVCGSNGRYLGLLQVGQTCSKRFQNQCPEMVEKEKLATRSSRFNHLKLKEVLSKHRRSVKRASELVDKILNKSKKSSMPEYLKASKSGRKSSQEEGRFCVGGTLYNLEYCCYHRTREGAQKFANSLPSQDVIRRWRKRAKVAYQRGLLKKKNKKSGKKGKKAKK